MSGKKIRFQVPGYLYNIIQEDQNRFELKNNRICNLIFERLKLRRGNFKIDLENKEIIQFNLNKNNYDDYQAMLGDVINGDHSLAQYFRDIFTVYANLTIEKREKLLFENIYKNLDKAIKNGNIIKLKYKEKLKYQKIEPCFMAEDPSTGLTYLCGWSDDHNDLVNYRLAHISRILVLENEKSNCSKYDIKTLQKHFDPFLSYGKEVVVKLTPKGEKLFNKFIHNRPKLLKKEGNIYHLESSNLKAKLFFSGFWEEVEIIEPQELKIWIKRRIEKMVKLYNLGE